MIVGQFVFGLVVFQLLGLGVVGLLMRQPRTMLVGMGLRKHFKNLILRFMLSFLGFIGFKKTCVSLAQN
jgi:hypothetical protein